MHKYREFGFPLIEIGLGIVFFFLSSWFPNMPDWMICSSPYVGGGFILVGIVMLFWKSKKKEEIQETSPANNSGIAMQRTSNSPVIQATTVSDITYGDKQSYTYNYEIKGFDGISQKELVIQIGTAVQHFKEEFDKVPYASRNERINVYNKVSDLFSKIEKDLFYRAKIVLRDTPILKAINDLKNSFEKYGNQLFLHWGYQEEAYNYMKLNEKVPQKLKDLLGESELSLDTEHISIETFVNEIIESASGGDEWYMI